jgi:hypothetical protein
VENDIIGIKNILLVEVDFSEFMEAVKGLGIFWAAVNEPPVPG